MEKITYTAPNLMDWVAQLRAGGAVVKVHFTGGAITAYGVTPASYTTSDPFIQKVIEQSSHFKEGRIKLDRRITLSEPVKSKTQQHPKPQSAAGNPTPPACPSPEAAESYPVENKVEAVGDAADTPMEETIDAPVLVAVSCLPDAQDYLQRNCSIPSHKVRTCAAAQKAALGHGVKFVGGSFDTVDNDQVGED